MESRDELGPVYRAAIYRVAAPSGPIDLRVGEGSPALDRALASLGVARWAYLTAVNPGSRRLADAENAARLARLDAEIARLGLAAWPGESRDPTGAWPAEESRLLLDVGPAAARRLAARFEQAAFLYGEAGGVPLLVWVAAEAR